MTSLALMAQALVLEEQPTAEMRCRQNALVRRQTHETQQDRTQKVLLNSECSGEIRKWYFGDLFAKFTSLLMAPHACYEISSANGRAVTFDTSYFSIAQAEVRSSSTVGRCTRDVYQGQGDSRATEYHLCAPSGLRLGLQQCICHHRQRLVAPQI